MSEKFYQYAPLAYTKVLSDYYGSYCSYGEMLTGLQEENCVSNYFSSKQSQKTGTTVHTTT